jgi:hypothetical protein
VPQPTTLPRAAQILNGTDVNLEVKAAKTKYTLMFHNQNAGQFHSTKISNKSLKPVTKFTYLGMK